MSSVESTEPRTYGNWRRPGGGGLLGLSKAATYTGLGLIAVAMIVMITVDPLAGLVLLTVSLAGLAAACVPLLHGRTTLQTITPRVAYGRDVVAGHARHRGGPLTRTETFTLPGLAAGTRLSEATDGQGRPFAIVTLPRRHHHTIVFAVDPDGAALVDDDDVDTWVARWGLWLAALGDEPSLLAVSVTVETSPDSGERLRRELAATTIPDAPAAAVAMLGEIAETYPTGSAAVRAMLACTFRGTRGQYRQDLERDLAGRCSHLSAGLHGTGAGAVRPMAASELCEQVRCAYDPAAQRDFDDARAAGAPIDLGWSQVGPAAADSRYGHLFHDDAASVTWAMTGAPRGNVPADILARLLRPHPDVDRKRVTLLYRPIGSARAARIVEGDHRDAQATVRNAKQPTARMLAEQDSTAQTRREETAGSGLVNFAMLITATAASLDRLPAASRAIEQTAPTARIQIRRCYGHQQAAFTACLPLGIVLPAHQPTRRVKEGL